MFALSSLMQWLLSASLLVAAYVLGRKAQSDVRLLPIAIILLLFAVPIPILASLFPGEDQLREFTSIKYGPPIAAFVESYEQELFTPFATNQIGLGKPSYVEEAQVEGPQFNQSQSLTKEETDQLILGDASLQSGSGSFNESTADLDNRKTNATTTLISEKSLRNGTQSCIEMFSTGNWNLSSIEEGSSADFPTNGVADKNFTTSHWEAIWEPDAVSLHQCNFTSWGHLESLALLARLGDGSRDRSGLAEDLTEPESAEAAEGESLSSPRMRVVVMGDSQGRLFAHALLRLLRGLQEDELDSYQQKHSDWNATIMEDRVSLEFWWAPFATNATDRLQELSAAEVPDVLVMSFGLWHMLYTNDPEDYGRALKELQATLQEVYRIPGGKGPRSFLLNIPFLMTEKLNTEAKRTRMTEDMQRAYNEEEIKSGLLMPQGGVFPVDLFQLTRSCGDSCAGDGMHYFPEAYDVAVQIMLNIAAATLSL